MVTKPLYYKVVLVILFCLLLLFLGPSLCRFLTQVRWIYKNREFLNLHCLVI